MKWLIIPTIWLLYWGMCFIGTGSDKKNLAVLFFQAMGVTGVTSVNKLNAF